MKKASIEGISFIAVVILVTTAFVWLVLPYYGAVLWANIAAMLFHPVLRRRRQDRTHVIDGTVPHP